MSVVTDILDASQLHDLWGSGYTITLRPRDPYDVPAHIVPKGVSYQWNPIKPDPEVKVASAGWSPVPNVSPFFTAARLPEQSAWGCAFSSEGRPWVAQRV